MINYRFLLPNVILLFTLTLTGCIGKGAPTHQFTLESLPGSSRSALPAYTGQGMILIGPVHLPQQLTGQGIVTRLEPTVVNTSATNFWAGPLDEQISTVLSRELAALLQTDKTAPYPGPRFGERAYQVELTVEQFSGTLNGKFTCTLHWTLNDLRTRKIIERKSVTLSAPVSGSSYQDYAAAASRVLADLSSTQLAPATADIARPQ